MRKSRMCGTIAMLLAMVLASPLIFAQNKTISGVVSDESGKPLEGATVTPKGGSGATTTNKDGTFKIDVAANVNTLIISYVGMEEETISIAGRTNLRVTLKSTESKLGEVVLIGYGRARRANLTVAQSTVSAKDIEKTVNTTFEQAIQGRAAGVYVTQNSGQPGGGMSVNIRGISSLNRTQPLYVIDGIQIQSSEDVSYGAASSANPLAGLNPADIDDIQILQGPSATAIYGSRGTNGVVLITTKRGKAGDFKMNYGFQYSIQTPPQNLDIMNLQQYATYVKGYHTERGVPQNIPVEFLDPSILGPGTDWQKELFNNAAMQKHQLSVSGGSNNTTYYLSGEYLNQDGVAEGSGFKRYGLRANLDNKPRDWATIGLNLAVNQTNEILTTTGYNDPQGLLIANALRLTPQIPVTNLDGSWGASDPVNGAGQFAPINPLALASFITNKNMRREISGGLNIGLTLAKGLVFRSSLYASMGNGLSTYYTPTYNLDQWHHNTVSSLTTGTYSSWYWNWNEMLEYSRQIGKHNFTVMASHEAQESKWQAVSASRTGFLTNDIFDVSAGDPLSAGNGGGTYPWAMESYLGRVTYNYDNRYLVTGTIRRDGSVNFGSDKKWGNFPSVSAAWRVSQEKFFDVPFISELKIRLETGLTGNQGTGTGIYSALNTGATPWGTGLIPSNLTNKLLQWESTNTNNIGINIGLIKNRINIEADYYVKKTNEMIMPANHPWYLGTNGSQGSLNPELTNAGSLSTNGWGITINTTNIQTKDFKWESNFNISHFKTLVNQLYQDNPFIERVSWYLGNLWPTQWTQRSAVGFEPWLFRGYIEDGLFQSVDDINKSPRPVDNGGLPWPADPNNPNSLWVGDKKYKDLNGDKKIDVNDMTNIGNPWPKLTAGFTNTFSYKGFDLSILFTATYGNDIYNYIAQEMSNPNNINLSRNMMVGALDYARLSAGSNPTIVNKGTNVPRLTGLAGDYNYLKFSNRYVEDGSYLRLKNVSLSYNVPQKYLAHTKVIRGLRATISAQNVFTLTHYTGYDPEVGAYVGFGVTAATQPIGVDYGRYPLTPIYTGTISVNF